MGDGSGPTEYFEQTKSLKDTDLTRVRGVKGVQWAVRLFKGNPVARTSSGKFAVSFLIGLDDATLAGAPRKMLMGSWQRLREPNSVVIDKAGYILLFRDEPLQLDRILEMNDHRVPIRRRSQRFRIRLPRSVLSNQAQRIFRLERRCPV